MSELRAEIDALDREIVALLVRRAACIDRATELKQGLGWPARIGSRVEEVALNARARAAAEGLDPDFIEGLWRQIIEWSIAREAKVLGTGQDGGGARGDD
jgi:isochorismate pyruvate lyase